MVVDLRNPQDDNWLSRQWSTWIVLAEALRRGVGAPRQPGIYRIRDARSRDSLLYIGQSDNIRGRLFQLRNAMIKVSQGKKQGPPHWAGACVLQQQNEGALIEVSWLIEAVTKEAERKGLECEYIAAHRWVTGRNPGCQFVAITRRS